jgi:serine/threonine protein kinase
MKTTGKAFMASPLLPPSSPPTIFRITSVTDFTDSDHSPTDSPVELRWKGRGRAPERTPSPRRRRRSGAGRRYRRGKRMQEPHLSEVRVGEDTKHGDRRVVLKEPFRPSMVAAELAALKRLQPHPSVVTLLDFFDDKGATFLVFKFVPGMDLLDWLDVYFENPRPEPAQGAEVESEMLPLARQLALALRYCHEHGVAHRDVKPDNVRVDPLNQHVTLIDFGLAYVTEHDMDAQARVGSLDYAAPEIRRSRSSTPKGVDDAVDPFKCDVWSLGVTLHAMTHYALPFCEGRVSTRAAPAEHFSPALRAAINTLLTEDPRARPDMKAAVALEWFRTEGATEEA